MHGQIIVEVREGARNMAIGLLERTYGEDGFRTCEVTGLRIHRSAEVPVKMFGLTAVVALIIGGIAALLVALTRWEAVGILQPAAISTST